MSKSNITAPTFSSEFYETANLKVGHDSASANSPELSSIMNCANLNSIEEFETLVEGIKQDMKRKEILDQHKSNISQLPNGRWYTRINGKKYERVNRKDLEDLIIAKYTQEEIITLNTIYNSYLNYRKMVVTSRTWKKDIQYFDCYIKNSPLAQKDLQSLTLDDGYAFLDYCLKIKPNMKRKYWDNVRGCLNQMFQYCLDRNLINRNPIEHMKPQKDLFAAPTKTRDGDTVFTREEQMRVVTLAEDDSKSQHISEPLGIVLLFNLGIRDGELCALKWSDIESNFRGEYIHIQREMVANIDENGKNNGYDILPHCKTPAGDRRLPLNLKARQTLSLIKEINKSNNLPIKEDDFIFLRWVNNELKNCTPRSFDTRLRKYCKHAGMEIIKSPHDVRRTVLTNLYMAHMPLKKIQEFAGHSSLKQTMDYIRITDDDMDMMQYLDTLSEGPDDTIIPFRNEHNETKKVNTGEH